MNIFFDVQGTLLSGGLARPGVRNAFEELMGMGHHVYIWSGGGASYAKSAAETLGVDDIVFGCYSKSGSVPVYVDYVVDDFEGLVASYGGYTVPPYEGDPSDDVLSEVVDAIRDQGEQATAR